MLLETEEHEETGCHSDTAPAAYVSQMTVVQMSLADQTVQCMTNPVSEIQLNTFCMVGVQHDSVPWYCSV
jgi:hypothetical protein